MYGFVCLMINLGRKKSLQIPVGFAYMVVKTDLCEEWAVWRQYGNTFKAQNGTILVYTYGYDFPDGIIETAVELFKGLAGVRP